MEVKNHAYCGARPDTISRYPLHERITKIKIADRMIDTISDPRQPN
jgi:hypothetical protein